MRMVRRSVSPSNVYNNARLSEVCGDVTPETSWSEVISALEIAGAKYDFGGTFSGWSRLVSALRKTASRVDYFFRPLDQGRFI